VRRLLAAALALILASPALAWEPATTNAGLSEAAALGSHLHARLVAMGHPRGLYTSLGLSRTEAPEIYGLVPALDPSDGVVPDARGRQTALGWLTMGAIVESVPPARSRAHSGAQALPWLTGKDRRFGIARFWTALAASALGATPAERDGQLARALLIAGATLTVLEDAGSPPRAREDWGAFQSPLGGGNKDRGSRIERLAALGFGRLGIAVPKQAVARAHLADFFSAADQHGLRDLTLARLPFSRCAPAELVEDKMVSDEVAITALERHLPLVASYAAGLVDFLFRGELVIKSGMVVVGDTALGAGKLTLLGEDAKGLRRTLSTVAVTGGAPHALLAPAGEVPAGQRLVAVFRGQDAAGEELVAIGVAPPLPAAAAPATQP
jgi:hypothetical protein